MEIYEKLLKAITNSYARANLKTIAQGDSAIIDGQYFEKQELKDFLENETTT